MIAVAKKKAVRKDDDSKRDRYRVYSYEAIEEEVAKVRQRIDEMRAILADMREHDIEAVGIDGAGAIKRGLDELDTWIDLVTSKVVVAKRRQSRGE